MKIETRTEPAKRQNAGPSSATSIVIRKAGLRDAERMRAMHRLSLRAMGRSAYSQRQVDGFLRDVETVDEGILSDGTFFLAEADGGVVASGAWTLRKPAYAARLPEAVPGLIEEPRATIRSVFTHPGFVRRGLASAIIRVCEEEAVIREPISRIELHATLTAEPLYRGLGYQPQKPMSFPLSNGEHFPAIFMIKSLETARQEAA